MTLIVPDLALPVGQAEEEAQERYPSLERLIARGAWRLEYPATDKSAAALRPWQRGLLAAAELGVQAGALASAPVSAASLGTASGYWMHADLVHLIAGVERLELTGLAAHELDARERDALHGSIAAHVQEAGYELICSASGDWLLRAEQALDITTYCAELAMAVDMHTAMPRGTDAGALRRLLTELQMLLHEHPVNLAREARGLRAANGIWAWGAGTLPALTARPPPHVTNVVGNDSFLQGLSQLFQYPHEPAAANGEDLLARCRARTIAVERVSDLATLETAWIAPLSRALAAGRIGALDLVLDGWLLEVDRRELLRIWRRPRPLTEQPT